MPTKINESTDYYFFFFTFFCTEYIVHVYMALYPYKCSGIENIKMNMFYNGDGGVSEFT